MQPAGRLGSLVMEEDAIVDFQEKPAGDGQWINGGFFVLSPKVGDYIAGDATPFEQDSLKQLAAGRSAARVPSSGLLAADGHAAGQEPSGRAVGVGKSGVEDVEIKKRSSKSPTAARARATAKCRRDGSVASQVIAAKGAARTWGTRQS